MISAMRSLSPVPKLVFATALPVLVALAPAVRSDAAQMGHELRYEQPAEHFEETLLLGNGRVGASLFGSVKRERIYDVS
jgi:alpha-L-fucosidase 2